MAQPTTAIDYLKKPGKLEPQPVNAVFGEEPYLKRRVVDALAESILSGEDREFALTKLAGPDCEWRDVADELATGSLFGDGQRLVLIEDADDFISAYRGQLEDYISAPSTSGTLVLVAAKWPKNTRLYKSLAECGLQIDCSKPKPVAISKWLKSESRSRHKVTLAAAAADELLELIGPELGLLDQELTKLALCAEPDGEITADLVREMTGGWRAKTGWEMLDAACDGDAAAALEQLERLIYAGEHPIAILGQVSYSLRRFAAATRIFVDAEAAGRRISLRKALEEAGFKPFVIGKVEKQIKRIGRQRCGQLYRWLLDADLALKGTSSTGDRARLVLEQLIVRIATPQEKIAV